MRREMMEKRQAFGLFLPSCFASPLRRTLRAAFGWLATRNAIGLRPCLPEMLLLASSSEKPCFLLGGHRKCIAFGNALRAPPQGGFSGGSFLLASARQASPCPPLLSGPVRDARCARLRPDPPFGRRSIRKSPPVAFGGAFPNLAFLA